MLRNVAVIVLLSLTIVLALSLPVCMRSNKTWPQPPEPPSAAAVIEVGAEMPGEYMDRLREVGWDEHAPGRLGLWVSAARQEVIGIEAGRVVFKYPCSTAAAGIGNRANSRQTPPGWHVVEERFGDGLPVGAVFKERKFTGRVYDPANPTRDDLVLTRIMWLRGLEPDINAGGGVDTHARFIYIHGTPEEDKLGSPASLGCIRMSNQGVADLYDQAPSGTPVLITEW